MLKSIGTSLVNQIQDESLVPSCVYVHLGPTATQEVNASSDSTNNNFFIGMIRILLCHLRQ